MREHLLHLPMPIGWSVGQVTLSDLDPKEIINMKVKEFKKSLDKFLQTIPGR